LTVVRRLGLAIGVVLVCVSPSRAQTLITSTTLNGQISATQTSIVVTSATGWTVNNYVFVEHEAMQIRVVSGTTITVSRAVLGTRAAAHATGKTLLTGAAGHFLNMGPLHSPPIGYCTRSDQTYLPLIDVTSGNIWTCNSSHEWVGTNAAKLTYDSLTTN